MRWRKESRKMGYKRCLVLFGMLLSMYFSNAQSTWEDNSKIDDKQIVIEKNRKIELPEASRNFQKMEYTLPKPQPQPQKYEAVNLPMALPSIDTKIKVLSVKDDQLGKLYGNYIKVGGGNYSTFFGEGYIHSKRDEKLAYGLSARYFNSLTGPVSNSGNNDLNLTGFGRLVHSKALAKAVVEYQRQRFNYYGYDQQKVSKTADEVRLVYNQLNIGVQVASQKDSTPSKTEYQLGLNYHYMNNLKANEGELLAQLSGKYTLDSTKAILLKSEFSFVGRTDSLTWSRNLVSIQPGFGYVLAGIRLKGYLNFTFLNDTIGQQKSFQLYPVLNAEYDIFSKKMTLFAGIDGRMERRTWRTSVLENPFVKDRVPVFHANKTFEGYVGLRGTFMPSTYFSTQVAYANFKNMGFFVNDLKDSSMFNLVYETGNTGRFNYNAQFQYFFRKSLKFDIGVDVFSYSVSSIQKAWHKPNFLLNTGIHYNLKDKIFVRLNLYYLGGITALAPVDGKERTLKDIIDLNLMLEYRFSPAFSAFLELNNILGNKYERYLFYQKKSINFLIGLSYCF